MSGTFHTEEDALDYIRSLTPERRADGFKIYEPRRERKLNAAGLKEFRPKIEADQQKRLALVWNFLIEQHGKRLGVDIAIKRLERPLPDEVEDTKGQGLDSA